MLSEYTITLTYEELITISMALGMEKCMSPDNEKAQIEALRDKISKQMAEQFWNRNTPNK